ncbi:MAG TPA: GNAT family N-acetyltransferase [Jatrophihabitans sp.]|jgi:RimJ/RimL family protein N-acetyltransferase|uniref:GNAT family N-acetyltransferase n=1 Tax=Jatrophihabitans sp. TaxID=1932789 RepID=UPI002E0A02A6|nr:GNAT family N-acetyltransferase [Jatrophihabitans sp.]
MALHTSTDPDEIDALLTRALEADPVRNTSFSSVRSAARRDPGQVWCAHDGARMAARSQPQHPVALTPGWTEIAELVEALTELPAPLAVNGPVEVVEAVATALGRRPVLRLDERLFRLDVLMPPAGVTGQARAAGADDIDLIGQWLVDFHLEAFGSVPPDFAPREQGEWAVTERRPWLWLAPDGAPVSMACRQPTVVGVARIGPVFTPREHRGHGFGSAVTARATADILADSAIPVLFTDLANPTSNKIYEALGYRAVEDRLALRF